MTIMDVATVTNDIVYKFLDHVSKNNGKLGAVTTSYDAQTNCVSIAIEGDFYKYAHEMELLAKSHVYVLDVTQHLYQTCDESDDILELVIFLKG